MSPTHQRFIGIRHRIKRTASGTAKPTQVCIVEQGKARMLDLDDEQAELDFVHGVLAIEWCEATDGTDYSLIPERHRKAGRKVGDQVAPELVACGFAGLMPDDLVVMTLGGSGNNLAFALSRRAEKIGARVVRITPKALKERRGDGDTKSEDAALLAEMAETADVPMWDVGVEDREVIVLRNLLDRRSDAMASRIACAQQLRQRFIGQVFCTEDGGYPEGGIEAEFAAMEANDVVLSALVAEEKARTKALTSHLESLDVYQRFFEPVKGCGPMIAARIISDVGDIRRFESVEAFKKYMGVHVASDGSFPRSKKGGYSGKNQRLAFYLLGSQFVKSPTSEWGAAYRTYRAKFEAEETVASTAEGRKFSKGKVHSKAFWRTITRFAEKLWRDWYRYEVAQRGAKRVKMAAAPVAQPHTLVATSA